MGLLLNSDGSLIRYYLGWTSLSKLGRFSSLNLVLEKITGNYKFEFNSHPGSPWSNSGCDKCWYQYSYEKGDIWLIWTNPKSMQTLCEWRRGSFLYAVTGLHKKISYIIWISHLIRYFDLNVDKYL